MGDKPKQPAAPDYTPYLAGLQTTAASDAEAARMQADVAKQALAQQDKYAGRSADVGDKYYQMALDAQKSGQEQVDFMKPYLAEYLKGQLSFQDAAQANLEDQTKYAALQRTQAQETYDRYKTQYAPREDQFLKEAYEYASPARQEEAAGAARADVTTAFGAQRDKAVRDLASYGISPGTGRYSGLQAMDIGQAAAGAAAGTQARNQIETQGKQFEVAALQQGRGLPTQAIGLGQLGLGATASGLGGAAIGGGGVTAGNQNLYASTIATGSPGTYAGYSNPYTQLAGAYGSTGTNLYGTSNSALGNAGNAFNAGGGILNTMFGNQMEGYRASVASAMAPWQALGEIGGRIAGGWAGGGFK